MVVVGGGFAGLAAVRALDGVDVEVLLLDRAQYSTFQPLLYQVATGGLNSGDVTFGQRAFASKRSHTRFRRATVTGVDTAQRHVHLEDGDAVPYDYLILSCGVGANFFGIPGAAEHAMTVYTPNAARTVRDRLFSNIEAFAQGHPGAVEPVVVIVGAGATGVETAGALAELRNAVLPRSYPEIDPARVRVVLVEMTPDVLGPFDARLRSYAAEELRARGVELRLDTTVTEVRPDRVVFDDGTSLPSSATIWASGVTARDEVGDWALPQGRGGRIQVGPDLRVAGHTDVFAVGDVAANPDDPLPQLAQPAMQGGKHAAGAITRLIEGETPKTFTYRDKGTMATIGRGDAVVQLPGNVKLTGAPAWVLWMAVHVVMLTGNRNRLATLANLAVRYLRWPSAVDVVVGDPPPPTSWRPRA